MSASGLSEQWYLGVDGGGSTCRVRLADADGNLVGEAQGGPANLRLGAERVVQEIRQVTEALLQQVGLNLALSDLKAGVGLAGLVVDSDYTLAEPIRRLFGECYLSNDAYIACLGAHAARPGGILIVGTGSCAQIITEQDSRTFGGWGFLMGDQGSGAVLGREAIRLSLLALEDLIPASALTDAINQHFHSQPKDYLSWSVAAKPADYAQFAPIIIQHADQGDFHAKQLMHQSCLDVLRIVEVLKRYQTGRISLMGGLAATYLRYLPEHLRMELVPPLGDALDGALWLARGKGIGKEAACA